MSYNLEKADLGFPLLVAHAAELPLEHLQLRLSTTNALRQHGERNIADFIETVRTEEFLGLERIIALEALDCLANVCNPKGIDWYGYWKRRGFVFNHMYLTCTELDRFVEGTADFAVNKASFGNAGVILGRAGYGTIAKLNEGLKVGIQEVPDFSEKTLGEFFKCLMQLIRALRENKVTPQGLAKKYPILADPSSTKYRLHENILRLGIGILHAGPKTELLRSVGYKTIGDITSAGAEQILSLTNIGKTTYKMIERSLAALSKAQTSSGAIDWEDYSQELEIPMVPPDRMIADGSSFVAMVATTIGQLGSTLGDPVLQKILSERISRPPHDQATLEEIGSTLPVTLTKERIRQREEMFLEAVSAALVYDDYSDLNIHFRPEFSSYWKRAAEHFSDSGEDLPFTELVDGLVKTWGVAKDVLYMQLPLITAVISGGAMSTATYGDITRLDPRLLSLSETEKAVPLGHLQIRRSARALKSRGINTVGDLVEKIICGEVSRSSSLPIKTAIDNLDVVAENLDPVHGINWERYLELTQTQTFPTKRVGNASEFFSNLQENVSEFLEAASPRLRSQRIFEMRTSRPNATRLTLEQVASALNTYPSSVNKEEIGTLAFLNNVFLEGDHSLAGVHFRPEFARMWDQIKAIFDEVDGNAKLFQRLLAADFNLSKSQIEAAMPTLIAVLTGYPYRKLEQYTRLKKDIPITDDEPESKKIKSEPVPLDRIKLKAFRRTH